MGRTKSKSKDEVKDKSAKAKDKAGKAAKAALKTPDDTMSLTDHLRELRQRLVKSILAVIIGLFVVFTFYEPVIRFLGRPYTQLCKIEKYHCDGRFIITDPLGPIAARLRVSGWGGIVLSLPVVLWQIWQFVMPALHKKEKRYAFPFITSSLILFTMGASIAYLTLDRKSVV